MKKRHEQLIELAQGAMKRLEAFERRWEGRFAPATTYSHIENQFIDAVDRLRAFEQRHRLTAAVLES